jgi:hypothetical protein
MDIIIFKYKYEDIEDGQMKERQDEVRLNMVDKFIFGLYGFYNKVEFIDVCMTQETHEKIIRMVFNPTKKTSKRSKIYKVLSSILKCQIGLCKIE